MLVGFDLLFSFTYTVTLCHLDCHWPFPAKFSCYTFESLKLLQYPIYPPERQHTARFSHYTSALTGAEGTDQFPFCFNSLLKAIPKGTEQHWLLEGSMLNHPARMNLVPATLKLPSKHHVHGNFCRSANNILFPFFQSNPKEMIVIGTEIFSSIKITEKPFKLYLKIYRKLSCKLYAFKLMSSLPNVTKRGSIRE